VLSACNKFPCPKANWSALFLDQIIHVIKTPDMYGLQSWMVSQASTDTMVKKATMTLMGTEDCLSGL